MKYYRHTPSQANSPTTRSVALETIAKFAAKSASRCAAQAAAYAAVVTTCADTMDRILDGSMPQDSHTHTSELMIMAENDPDPERHLAAVDSHVQAVCSSGHCRLADIENSDPCSMEAAQILVAMEPITLDVSANSEEWLVEAPTPGKRRGKQFVVPTICIPDDSTADDELHDSHSDGLAQALRVLDIFSLTDSSLASPESWLVASTITV